LSQTGKIKHFSPCFQLGSANETEFRIQKENLDWSEVSMYAYIENKKYKNEKQDVYLIEKNLFSQFYIPKINH